MIPIKSKADAAGIKRWLLNCERDSGTDWGLSLWWACRRDDGSVWALVDSGGSGCVDEMARYGYAAHGVRLLGEMPEWECGGGHLGKMEDAKFSAYLDAEPGEFFREGSAELAAQDGLERFFLSEDEEALARARECIEQAASRLEPRLIPRMGRVVYTLTDAGAKVFGLPVSRMGSGFLEEVRKLVEIQDIAQREGPTNVAMGFRLGRGDKTVHLWVGGALLEYPMVGESLDDEELVQMGRRNLSAAYEGKFEQAMRALGFTRLGGLTMPDKRSSRFYKRIDGEPRSVDVEVECLVPLGGAEDVRRQITVELSRPVGMVIDSLKPGSDKARVVAEPEDVEQVITEMVKEFRQSSRA